jgi:hypothetical protein
MWFIFIILFPALILLVIAIIWSVQMSKNWKEIRKLQAEKYRFELEQYRREQKSKEKTDNG